MIYFDHSATTPIHPDVLKKMHEVNRDFFANPSSIYKTGRKSRLLVEKARTQVANAIGASSEQIYFSSGGTEANNHVLWQIIKQEKKHVIISEIEHPAVSKVLKEIEISNENKIYNFSSFNFFYKKSLLSECKYYYFRKRKI